MSTTTIAKPDVKTEAPPPAKGRRGSPAGSNNGGGRRAQSPVDYQPSAETIEKRKRGSEVFTDQDVETARKAIIGIASGLIRAGKGTNVRLSAALAILDRKFGRPPQEHVFIGDDTKPPIRVDSGVLASVRTEELVAAARGLLKAQGVVSALQAQARAPIREPSE